MAVRITKCFKLGPGEMGYEFEVYGSPVNDKEVYEGGLRLEKGLRGLIEQAKPCSTQENQK